MANTKAQLLLFVTTLDSLIDYDVVLVAFGGTALSILDAKNRSEDVDFIVKIDPARRDVFFEAFFKTVKSAGLEYGMNPPFDDFDTTKTLRARATRFSARVARAFSCDQEPRFLTCHCSLFLTI